ncbi:MAG TPA: DUF1501 domain-containing protein [Blastocatellia bacterium]|nr:DUF1501 domain-containing protein [Blastocatellia bacterium]
MPVTRRQFIKRSAAMVTIGLVLPKVWLGETRAEQASFNPNRKLVVIQLAGGNDGFNTVIPYTDARYYSLRPTLAFKEAELKDANGRTTLLNDGPFGFHPAMGEIKDLYDQHKVAIVLGAGYANPTLSHFLSMDIWHTADTSGLASRGWLGKYADIALVNGPSLSAASIGSLDLPKSLNASRVVVPSILNFSLYNFLTDPGYSGDYANQLRAFNENAGRVFSQETFLGAINNTALASVQWAQRVQTAVNSYQSSVVYPLNNPLAVGLKMVAQLITTVPEASLLYVSMGGFDNHSDQIGDRRNDRTNKLIGDHALLLRWFSEAVDLFHADLQEHNLADQVVMMQWSEFGRRPGENASFGTDHGTAAPVFVIGNPVQGGLYGSQPSLEASVLDRNGGNTEYTTDFREVYSTILDKWLNVDSKAVLGAQYANAGFLS